MVLILTMPPFPTDFIVSTQACSSAWYLPNNSCQPQIATKLKDKTQHFKMLSMHSQEKQEQLTF